MNKYILPVVLLTLLGGCDYFKSEAALKKSTVTITIVDGVQFKDKNQQGWADWQWNGSKNECVIQLRDYPNFLGHEVRHCFEGHWHEGKNGEQY